ncbi:DUF116 domain-containing protein [Clostridioides difficile]|uniref:DUF116 domain-containing protein n=1 Tax=Clostridioides difficile TaxID=1496 RepID=UPI00097FF4FD|nr:DUF116 domain-containing protein [Clostridioides difficile]SJO33097.1 Protein of uncharacterised function DUF116 [Clostridioides difficile]
MTDIKKYLTSVGILILILGILIGVVNFFIISLTQIFSLMINIIIISLILIILCSTVVTYRVIKGKYVNSNIMKINFNIVSGLFPIISFIASSFGMSKSDIRRIYIKLNNEYIYSNKYNFNSEDIIILIPHCIQENSCKLKVTNDIDNCKECGRCNIGELIKLKEKTNVKIFVATGGTLARKIIMDTKPKAVVAVACERDLTSGIQDIKKIPVLGVFNKRPNGPCVNTNVDMMDIEKAIGFLTGKNILVCN